MKRTLSILLAALLLLFALPTVAEEGALQAGLYTSDTGACMYLDVQGVGVLDYEADGKEYAAGVIWTESSLEIERTAIPFALTDGVLSFTFEDVAFAFHFEEQAEAYALGDLGGTNYAGAYGAEDGLYLTITADGKGVYGDAAGERIIYWGSLLPYWPTAEEGTCFILFDSYLGSLTFGDGGVVVSTDSEEDVVLQPIAADPVEVQEQSAAKITLVSRNFGFSLDLPVNDWRVEETEGGLLVSRKDDSVHYTFLSLALPEAPNAAALDAYADLIWADSLMGVGVAYDAAETVRADYAVGEAVGRSAATEWERGEALFAGNAVLWYANGCLNVVLCAANENTMPDALALLNEVLPTFVPVVEADHAQEDRLLVDGATMTQILEMPAVAEAPADVKLYYGYKMGSDGEEIELIPFMSTMGLDPKMIYLEMRADGTGHIQIMDEGSSADFTWTDEVFIANDESIPYTREGDHIIISTGAETIEFAPEEEIETLLTGTAPVAEKEKVTPTAEALVGTWNFTRAMAMGLEVPAAEMGTTMSLVLNEDGTAIMLTDGSPTELEWTIREDGMLSLTLADTEVFAFSFDGSVLTLDTGTTVVEMIFEKEV